MDSGFRLRPAGPRVHLVALRHSPLRANSTSTRSSQAWAGALPAHATARQLNCFILGLRSDGMITGIKGQMRWPQGSPFDCFHVLAAVLGVWQQRQWLGM